jgi:hypothetical protein
MRLVGQFREPDQLGTFAFLAHDQQDAVLAFRGTQPDDPTDIFDDVRIVSERWAAGGKVHAGFADALQRVWPEILPQLAALGKPLSFTGHSLGAALATLAASLHLPGQLITFGSPRVGDAEFVASLPQRVQVQRYVNCCDIVCQLPPFDYEHLGELHYLNRDGDEQVNPPEEAMTADQVIGHAEYLRDYIWVRGNVATRNLADHAPINYVSALAGGQP